MLLTQKSDSIDVPNLTLYYQLKELKPLLEGAFINRIQELKNNWLKFKLRTTIGSKDLILTPTYFFFSDYRMDAKQQTSGYGAFLRKRIEGKRIESIFQHELERVVKIKIADFFLVLELFAKGNILLLDSEENILMPLRKEEWSSRKLKKGEKYVAPPALGENPLSLTEDSLKKILLSSEEDTIHALIKGIALAPLFLEEVCFNAGIEKNAPAKAQSQESITRILKEINALFSQKVSPVLIELKGKRILLPFSLNCFSQFELKSFPSITSALSELSAQNIKASSIPKESAKLLELKASLEKQKQSLQLQERMIFLNKKSAEAIYANFPKITKVLNALESLKKQKLEEKEIMYNLKNNFPFVKDLDLHKKILTIELD